VQLVDEAELAAGQEAGTLTETPILIASLTLTSTNSNPEPNVHPRRRQAPAAERMGR
jgi:hypothetical protein